MVGFVELIKLGLFMLCMFEFGLFWGVCIDGWFVVMVGICFNFDGYIEVSGVCIYFDFCGCQFVFFLLQYVVGWIMVCGDIFMLYVYVDNIQVIVFYEWLGFDVFWEVNVVVVW